LFVQTQLDFYLIFALLPGSYPARLAGSFERGVSIEQQQWAGN